MTVGIAPISAAIITGYAAAVTLDNFSHRPNKTGTVTNTYTQTTANSGSVSSEDPADTVFISNSHELLAANLSQSKVIGSGNNYFGLAQSEAAVIGDFSIKAKETFSFTVETILHLLTSVSNPQSERASAKGSISFALIDTVSNLLLESFQFGIGVHSFKAPEVSLSYNLAGSFNPTQINFAFLAQGNTTSLSLYTSGVYSRTFDSTTNLRLVEVKKNMAVAQAQAVPEAEPVPEPTTILGTAMFFGFLTKRRKLKNKLSEVKSKV